MGFLISEPKSSTCTRLAEVTGISHDSVNRFLQREDYQPKDMFDEAAQDLCLVGGTLSADDTVLDKPHSNYVALDSHFWGYVPDNGCSAKPLARSALSDCFIRHSYFLRLEITYKHEIGNKNVLLKKSP